MIGITLLISGLILAAIGIFWGIFARRRVEVPDSGASFDNANMNVRISNDGFYLDAPTMTPGSRVRYDCLVNGMRLADVVALSGVETFVYTGGAPAGVRILQVIRAGGLPWRTSGTSIETSDSMDSTDSDDNSSFLGSPSAY